MYHPITGRVFCQSNYPILSLAWKICYIFEHPFDTKVYSKTVVKKKTVHGAFVAVRGLRRLVVCCEKKSSQIARQNSLSTITELSVRAIMLRLNTEGRIVLLCIRTLLAPVLCHRV
jgi:hypothetical protein